MSAAGGGDPTPRGRVAVVGSGPAGVCAAARLLDAGFAVELLDYGVEPPAELEALGAELRAAGPQAGERLRALASRADSGGLAGATRLLRQLAGREALLDLTQKTRLGSGYVFRELERGHPLIALGPGAPASRSLARGGLSNVWGAACYPLAREDYAGWPLAVGALDPHYARAARLLSLSESEDGLREAYALHSEARAALPLNTASARLLEHWQRGAAELAALGVAAGRARLAVRAETSAEGSGCQACGLCLYGCPWDSIYRADWTLRGLERRSGFRYRPGWLVTRFEELAAGLRVHAQSAAQGAPLQTDCDALFLAAGTLASLRIAAVSLGRMAERVPLQDNDLYLLPLLRSAGGRAELSALRFSLNELALRFAVDGVPFHLQLYALSPAVLERAGLALLPRALQRRASALQGRLLLGFLYLPGAHSARIAARLREGAPVATIELEQRRNPESARLARAATSWLWRARRALGFAPLAPPIRSTPSGNSGGHLVGGLALSDAPRGLASDADGRVCGTRRVFAVDGSALPQLPPQNSTFTIMANADRVAARYAERVADGSP